MTITIIVLIITIAMFIWGRVRGDIVALSSLMVLTATGVLTTSEALSGFSSPILIMMVGLFVVGGAILQTGLAQSAGNSISKMAKGNETRALIYVVLATSIIGAFVSNTGTVAIMMPIIMSMAASSGIRSSRLLMPDAFAGSLGGMLTLIGTPPNLVISETLEENGYAPLKFFSFFPVGVIVIDFIPIAPVVAVVSAALLMVFAGCFRSVDAAYKTINWESVMLIASMMPMSIALEKTGVSQIVSENLVRSLGALGPYALLAGMYFTTSLMTMFISNTATAVLMAPIALTAAQQIGVSPYSFMFAVTLGASMCFASPFSTPPNALVMKAGRYTFMDYIIVGLPLQIIIGIVMTIILPLLFPF